MLGSLSADRREGGLRAGDQDVRGVIDGTTITLPQLRTQKYRGATVYLTVVDWCRPAIVYSRHKRIITRIVFDGSNFVGTMESVPPKRPPVGRRSFCVTLSMVPTKLDPSNTMRVMIRLCRL